MPCEHDEMHYPSIQHHNVPPKVSGTRLAPHARTSHLALSLAAGHLPTLSLLESLSWRRHPSHGYVVSGLGMSYGVHMAINMAAGLLLLGGGGCSLAAGGDPAAVAALLIACYPVLPTSPTDNRSHLQARLFC